MGTPLKWTWQARRHSTVARNATRSLSLTRLEALLSIGIMTAVWLHPYPQSSNFEIQNLGTPHRRHIRWAYRARRPLHFHRLSCGYLTISELSRILSVLWPMGVEKCVIKIFCTLVSRKSDGIAKFHKQRFLSFGDIKVENWNFRFLGIILAAIGGSTSPHWQWRRTCR